MRRLSIFNKGMYLACAILLLLHTQCKRFVEVDDPTNQISQSAVFKEKSTALSALADIYANLRSSSVLDGTLSGANYLTGCYTDELAIINNQQGERPFYDLTVQSTTSDLDYLWVSAYKNIYASNNIIEGVAKSTGYLDEATRNSLTGEAMAIRAILHLYLSELFGEIPYVETTDYKTNQSISKNTLPQIYSKLKRDLQMAEGLISETYPAADRTRLNKAAVRLLLARVYLYDEDYANARHYANLVIGNPAYALEPELGNVFLKEAKSTVWQFAPVEKGANTLEGRTFIILNTPPPRAFLTQNLLNSFADDLRLSQWTKSITDGTTTYTYPYKYQQYSKTPVSLEYSVILRIEEAYLIAAEAENNLGNTVAALQRLSSIRGRAGLITPSLASQQVLADMILSERRHEFFTEGGHRFFDLKRLGLLDSTMTTVKPQWQTYMQNWPLPQRELLVNPNLNP